MNKKRLNISSNSPWEEKVGYSRAVKIDNHVYLAGTTATITDEIKNDPYLQTKECILKIEKALIKADASLEDVVRVRIYVVNIKEWELISKAFYEFFHKIRPAATMVEVSGLIAPELLVELEVDAHIIK